MSIEPDESLGASSVDVGTVPPTDPKDAPARLRGNMSTLQLVLMVLAFSAPIGVVAGVLPLVIGYGGGIAAPLVIIVLGLVMSVFAIGFSIAARKLPRAGAFYTFVTAGLGRPLGLSASFVAVFTYTAGMLGTIPFFGIALQTLITTAGGPEIAWWVWALIFVAVIGVLGYLRVDFSARVLGILVVCEVAAILVYDAFIIGSGGESGHLSFESFNPTELAGGGVAIGFMYAFIAFGGFETTAIFRDEVRDPVRTVPRATYIAIGLTAVFYALGSWLMINSFGVDNAVDTISADPGTAFLTSVHKYLGLVTFDIFTVLLVTSTLASLTALHNVIARYLFNLGVDGILPHALGRPHPRFGSPYRASLAFSIFVIVFIIGAALTPFSGNEIYATIIGLAGYAMVLLFFMASVGIAVYLIRTRPSEVGIWRRTIAPVTAVVLMGVMLVLVTINIDLATGSSTLSFFAIVIPAACIVLGIVVALRMRSKRPDTYRLIGTRD